jgi:hypothetical protein
MLLNRYSLDTFLLLKSVRYVECLMCCHFTALNSLNTFSDGKMLCRSLIFVLCDIPCWASSAMLAYAKNRVLAVCFKYINDENEKCS